MDFYILWCRNYLNFDCNILNPKRNREGTLASPSRLIEVRSTSLSETIKLYIFFSFIILVNQRAHSRISGLLTGQCHTFAREFLNLDLAGDFKISFIFLFVSMLPQFYILHSIFRLEISHRWIKNFEIFQINLIGVTCVSLIKCWYQNW